MFQHRSIAVALLAAAALAAPWRAGADENPPVYAGANDGLPIDDGLDGCDNSARRSGKAYAAYSFAPLPFQGGLAVPAIEVVGYLGGEVASGFGMP